MNTDTTNPTTLMSLLNSRLIELDRTHGSDSVATDVARSLQRTLRAYRGPTDRNALLRTLIEFHDTFLSCRPRMPNIISDLQHIILFLNEHPTRTISDLLTYVDELVAQKPTRRERVAKNALSLFAAPQVALVHSYSRTLVSILQSVLSGAPANTNHQVVVASHSEGKTRRIVRALQDLKAHHIIVPEYGIPHVVSRLTMALFGALSARPEQAILGPGSASLLSQLKQFDVPCYLALSTDKLSLWKDQTEPAFRTTKRVTSQEVEYERLNFSHDFVPLALFRGLITERGILSIAELETLFRTFETDFRQREAIIDSLRKSL